MRDTAGEKQSQSQSPPSKDAISGDNGDDGGGSDGDGGKNASGGLAWLKSKLSNLSSLSVDPKGLSLPSSLSISYDDLTHRLDAELEEAWQRGVDTLGLPSYAAHVPRMVRRMRDNFDAADPNSLASAVAGEKDDRAVNEHCGDVAHVRLGQDVCEEEAAYLADRLPRTKAALASFIGIDEGEIDTRDVPIIGIAGSGGGLRACLATVAYYDIFRRIGLMDCTHYLAGVSGSTWAQALLSADSIGRGDAARVFRHLQARTQRHIAEPDNLRPLLDRPADRYILRGIIERQKAGFDDFGLVELYGLLLACRYMLPNNEVKLDDADMRLSSQRRGLQDGRQPLPIYTVVRHELKANAGDAGREESRAADAVDGKKSYFQFFEVTPFEYGSEELGAWIPTWALGRKFESGKSIDSTPEMKLTTLLGTFSSAFCASLAHYYHEVQLVIPKSPIFNLIDEQLKRHEDSMTDIHLIDATKIPSHIKGISEGLPETCPSHLQHATNLELCDAGMSNNIPFYPLLRRDCDIVIAIDSSADIDKQGHVWFSETESYAKRRGLKAWPIGAGWPREGERAEKDLERATADSEAEADAMVERSKDGKKGSKYALDSVNIWVGQATESSASASDDQEGEKDAAHGPKAHLITDEDFDAVSDSTGVLLVYLPLLPHPDLDIDPATTECLSTWNFKYTPEECDSVKQLCEHNFWKSPGGDGEKRLRRAVKAMWQRKRTERLKNEKSSADS